MKKVCSRCGRETEGQEIAFCPYCGAKLPETADDDASRNPEAEKWVRKALSMRSYPERKKILMKGLEACPGSKEIEWELLFIGEEGSKKSLTMDYSIIRCWVLEIFRKPGDFSEAKRDAMRAQLFDSPQLTQCLAGYADPENKQQEYLLRLCREYIDIFLEGSSEIMGTIFGFSLGRNKEKRMALPVAQMIGSIRKDEKLSLQQREQLWQALYQAYSLKANGETEYLDQYITDN